MALPLIIIGGLLASGVGALGSWASQNAAKEERDELNSINEQIEQTASDTNLLLKLHQEQWQQSLLDLEESRDKILTTTIYNFAKELEKIRNIPENVLGEKKSISKIITINEQITEYKTNYVGIKTAEYMSNGITAVATAAGFGLIGCGISFVGGFVDFMRTSFKIDSANEELAKVNAQSSQMKIICSYMVTLSEFYKMVDDTIGVFDKFLDNSTHEIQTIIRCCGTDYKKYPDEVKSQMRNICNLAHGTYSLLNFDFIKSNGTVNIDKISKLENSDLNGLITWQYDKDALSLASRQLEELSKKSNNAT